MTLTVGGRSQHQVVPPLKQRYPDLRAQLDVVAISRDLSDVPSVTELQVSGDEDRTGSSCLQFITRDNCQKLPSVLRERIFYLTGVEQQEDIIHYHNPMRWSAQLTGQGVKER
ncbi:hypothetical protein Bpfe_015772 [Biomphalaria pfeifferi]|uniref:Uncharacterized protein n=1 Tax=Biomphalaria pfeifferi TaxID=112525 RepID=A0AAD8BJK1_BIOPF|nr:hypothetical protein Bpfe_015772 [Biomphalaria pfeifferi]